MTSYFSCLLECTECYSIFLVRRNYSKVFFRDGHEKLVLTLNLLFTAFSRYFCTLIFPRSLLSCRCWPSLSSGLVKIICALGNICHSETPNKESFFRNAKFYKIGIWTLWLLQSPVGLWQCNIHAFNSVVINKLRQDNSGQALKESVSADSEVPDIMFVCSMVDYGIHTYIEAVRYIFISKIRFCVLMVQIADPCCELKIENDIFVSHVGLFSEVMFL